MPSASQLQAAGQYHLIAAVRQHGGFKSIAARVGLSPQRLDKRGRKPKTAAAQEPLINPEPTQSQAEQTVEAQPRSGIRAAKPESKAHEQLKMMEEVKELQLV